MASRKGIPPKKSRGKKVAPSRVSRPLPTRAAAPGRSAPTSPRLAQAAAPSRAVAPRPTSPGRPVAPVARPTSPATRPAPVRPATTPRPAPKSVKVGAAISRELKALNQAKSVSAAARLPEQKAQADRETAIRTLRLKKMVDTSKAIRGAKPKKKKISHIQPVAPATITLRQSALAAEIAQKQGELRKLKAERAGVRSPLRSKVLDVAIKQKQEEIKHLQARYNNLKKGVDVYRPQRVGTSTAPPRVSLLLPQAHVKPTKEETERISKAIIQRTPRRRGESNEQYRARLFALIQRALVRFSQIKTQQMLSGIKPKAGPTTSPTPTMLPGEGPQPPAEDMSTGQLIVSIAEQTVSQDGATVTAEVESGGVVADTAADAMADSIDQAADTLNAAVAATEGVTGDQLAVEAEGEIAQQLEEGAVDESAVPLYKKPVVIAGAIAALGYYLYKRGVFGK